MELPVWALQRSGVRVRSRSYRDGHTWAPKPLRMILAQALKLKILLLALWMCDFDDHLLSEFIQTNSDYHAISCLTGYAVAGIGGNIDSPRCGCIPVRVLDITAMRATCQRPNGIVRHSFVRTSDQYLCAWFPDSTCHLYFVASVRRYRAARNDAVCRGELSGYDMYWLGDTRHPSHTLYPHLSWCRRENAWTLSGGATEPAGWRNLGGRYARGLAVA